MVGRVTASATLHRQGQPGPVTSRRAHGLVESRSMFDLDIFMKDGHEEARVIRGKKKASALEM